MKLLQIFCRKSNLAFSSVLNFNNFAIAAGYSCLDMVCGSLDWIDYMVIIG